MLATDLMRHVGELSDVTAAQVKESRSRVQKGASDQLAPFKRILDRLRVSVVRRRLWRQEAEGEEDQPSPRR